MHPVPGPYPEGERDDGDSEEEGEVSPERVYDTFIEQYVDIKEPYEFIKQKLIDISEDDSEFERKAEITLKDHGEIRTIVMVMDQSMLLKMHSMKMVLFIHIS